MNLLQHQEPSTKFIQPLMTTKQHQHSVVTSRGRQQNNNKYLDDKKVIAEALRRQYKRQSDKHTATFTSNYSEDNIITKSTKHKLSHNSKDYSSELVAQVKQRLSLPTDTLIPASFLSKHENTYFSANVNKNLPLTRTARRQSLYEIGFGQIATYDKLNILGAGTYSTVYKGTSRLTNKLVALKEIHLEQDEGVPFTAIREVSLLKELRHCNIITLHDIIYTRKTLTLVFEYVDRDLSRYMEECQHRINHNNVRLFLFQLLRGLKYCHDRRVLHRDLKPQNILISSNGDLKLADFGLARSKSVPTKTFTDEVVTLWYRPPDVLLGNVEYGTSIDIWGVGCIFFEMIAGHSLFTGTNPKKQIECIFEILGTPNDESWPSIRDDLRNCMVELERNYSGTDLKTLSTCSHDDVIDLLKKLLICNPQMRISAGEALMHEYFAPLPAEVHSLPHSSSIFSIPSIKLVREISRESPEQLHNVTA